MGRVKDGIVAQEGEPTDWPDGTGPGYEVGTPRADDGDPLGRLLIHEERGWWTPTDTGG